MSKKVNIVEAIEALLAGKKIGNGYNRYAIATLNYDTKAEKVLMCGYVQDALKQGTFLSLSVSNLLSEDWEIFESGS